MNRPEDYTDEVDFSDEWNKIVLWTFIENYKSETSKIEEMVLGNAALENSIFNDVWMPFFISECSEDARLNIIGRALNDVGCTSLEAFKNLIGEHFVVGYINSLTYWKDASKLIDAGDIFGFDSVSLTKFGQLNNKENVIANLYTQGKTKNTSTEIKNLFTVLVTSQASAEANVVIKPPVNNNHNNGNGGGGWSVSMPIAPTPVDSPEIKDEPEVIESIPQTTPQFDDLEKYEWAKDAINSLASRGIINGVGDGMFVPGGRGVFTFTHM